MKDYPFIQIQNYPQQILNKVFEQLAFDEELNKKLSTIEQLHKSDEDKLSAKTMALREKFYLYIERINY